MTHSRQLRSALTMERYRWAIEVVVRLLVGHQAGLLVLAEDRVRTFMRRRTGEQLLLAVNQIAGVVGGQLETVPVRNRVSGTRFHAVAAEDAAVVIDVVNLGVTLGATHALLGGVLSGFDVNTVRRTSGCAKEAGNALLQSVLISLQHVHAAE